tara:strand:- start:53181 stop:53609 length:429 start_codon:yes stop_codon:yes gene_type:complete
MNYLYDPDFLSRKTAATKRSLAENQPNADFVEFAAGVIYDRLKKNIQRYRVYGMYWWALKDVLARQGYDMGAETDDDMAALYKGADDAETLVAADLFYLDMSSQKPVDNNRWTIDNRRDDYVLYDADMEERNRITDSSFLVK